LAAAMAERRHDGEAGLALLSKPSAAHPVPPPKGEGRPPGAPATPTANGDVCVSDPIQGQKTTAGGRSGRFDEGTKERMIVARPPAIRVT